MSEFPEVHLNVSGTLASFHHTDRWIQSLLMAMGEHFHLSDFVETGTQSGNTVAAVRRNFSRVYSIELNEDFYKAALVRFADVDNVHLVHGSSGDTLAPLLQRENITKALFWLDAHGEGKATAEGDQLSKELQAIEQNSPTSLVVIDDMIKGINGYEVNFSYPFTTPPGWYETYLHNMSLLILHRGEHSMPEGLR